MSINAFLNLGAEAFEDAPVVEETPSVVVAPVSEEVVELIAERDDANLAVELARDAAEISSASRQVEEFAAAIERVENVQASMEHFIECGLSQKSAMMLHRQISTVMASIGKDGAAIGGGLENFENEEASIALLTAGLEALNSEKASLGEKIYAAIVNAAASIDKLNSRFNTSGGRLRARAEKLIAKAAGKSGSVDVSMASRGLVVKGGQASKNLKGDLEAYTNFITSSAARFFKDAGGYANGDLTNTVKKLGAARTMEEGAKLVNAIAYPGYPGATITVQDKPAFTIKRTEVVLGGYAVFDLQYKTTGGDTGPELVHKLKALGKNRVHVKQAPEETNKAEFTATLSVADAVALAEMVIKLSETSSTMITNLRWMDPFTKSIRNTLNAATASMRRSKDGDPKLAVVLDAAARSITGVTQSVSSLTTELPSSISTVGDAVLSVVAKVIAGADNETSSTAE